MEPNSFGVIRGEQPLIRASRASKVAGAFLVLFWHAKENIPGGDAFCKRHEARPTRILSVLEAAYFLAASAMLSCATSEGDTPGMRPA